MAAFATLDFPLTGVEVFRTDRGGGFDNARIDELLDVFDIRGSPSGKGDPYDNAVVESTDRLLKKELGACRNHYTSLEQLRSDPDDYVWRSDNQRLPLHPRIPEPQRIHTTRTRPLKNCPTRRCQSSVIGCFALVQTRTSNELAQDADAVSKEGVALAGTAKEIAAEANQKADKANGDQREGAGGWSPTRRYTTGVAHTTVMPERSSSSTNPPIRQRT